MIAHLLDISDLLRHFGGIFGETVWGERVLDRREGRSAIWWVFATNNFVRWAFAGRDAQTKRVTVDKPSVAAVAAAVVAQGQA